MIRSMYVYCLYCKTQRCKAIAAVLEIKGVRRAFSPQVMRKQRKKGKNIDTLGDLLPGYIFFYSDEELLDFSLFAGVDGIIRRVGRADERYDLQGADREFALKMLEKDGLLGAVRLFRMGDTVQLDDPLFKGCEGRVTKIDYRKERARIDFVFNNLPCYTWVTCELVRTDDPPRIMEE